jgi:hypothetical protein
MSYKLRIFWTDGRRRLIVSFVFISEGLSLERHLFYFFEVFDTVWKMWDYREFAYFFAILLTKLLCVHEERVRGGEEERRNRWVHSLLMFKFCIVLCCFCCFSLFCSI